MLPSFSPRMHAELRGALLALKRLSWVMDVLLSKQGWWRMVLLSCPVLSCYRFVQGSPRDSESDGKGLLPNMKSINWNQDLSGTPISLHEKFDDSDSTDGTGRGETLYQASLNKVLSLLLSDSTSCCQTCQGQSESPAVQDPVSLEGPHCSAHHNAQPVGQAQLLCLLALTAALSALQRGRASTAGGSPPTRSWRRGSRSLLWGSRRCPSGRWSPQSCPTGNR